MELILLEVEQADRLVDKQQSQQDHLLKFQADANAAMHQMMKDLMPKKSPLDKYKEQNVAFVAGTNVGDITPDVASSDLLNSNLIEL